MDWKRFYSEDAAGEAGREAVRAALRRWADGDPVVTDALRGGGIASFPHTMLRDSAEPIARVAASVLAAGFTHVVAFGVLHGGTLRAAERELHAELLRNGPGADAAFERLGGAFLVEPEEGLAAGEPWTRVDPALLTNEFSLDLFDRVLAEAARFRGALTPRVTRIFVGPTRATDGSFEAGLSVARSVAPLLRGGAACVATGDLVHFGNGYASDGEVAALPKDRESLTAHFGARVRFLLDAVYREGRPGAAHGMSTCELRNDQRNLLPVLAAVAGPGARADLLSFRLTDYGSVLGQAPPCFVASALYVVTRPPRAA